MFGMHFDNDSVLLNSMAAAYVHLADVKRYNEKLICVYSKAWNSYAIKVKCSQLAL